MRSASWSDRVLVAVGAGVVLFAVVARVHNVVAYPAIYDWDASAHAVNVVDVREGRLPNTRSWAGSHPPLYYAVGAALWAVLPESVPVHVALRSVSAGAWVASVGIVWRSLRRLGFRLDAILVAALLLGVPGITIASCMMTNDALCVLFMTATLVRLLEAPPGAPPARHAAVTGLLAGLAAISKATGLAVVGMAVATYAWRSRRSASAAVRNVLAIGLVAAAIAAPHYTRLVVSSAGSPPVADAPRTRYHVFPYNLLAGFSGSAEKEAISLLVLTVLSAQESPPAALALLHEALWGDPTAVFLPRDAERPVVLAWTGGLLMAALVVGGAVRLRWRRDVARRAAPVLAFSLAYMVALVPPWVVAPSLMLTKTNFLLPLALPLGVVLAVGAEGVGGQVRAALRAAILVVAAGGVAVTWYGWWDPARPRAAAVGARLESHVPAVAAVERYFAYRARDPIRAVPLLAAELHLAHELRLARILRVPFTPERGLGAEDARSLELARARQAWLELYNLIRWIQPIAAAMQADVVEVDQQRDLADVHVRVGALGPTAPEEASGLGPWPFPEFGQHFRLRRLGAEWQIAGITQIGVSAANAVPAFVAHSTLAGLGGLRALGWRPSWEEATRSVTGTFP
jgi:hypothetical protein